MHGRIVVADTTRQLAQQTGCYIVHLRRPGSLYDELAATQRNCEELGGLWLNVDELARSNYSNSVRWLLTDPRCQLRVGPIWLYGRPADELAELAQALRDNGHQVEILNPAALDQHFVRQAAT